MKKSNKKMENTMDSIEEGFMAGAGNIGKESMEIFNRHESTEEETETNG